MKLLCKNNYFVILSDYNEGVYFMMGVGVNYLHGTCSSICETLEANINKSLIISANIISSISTFTEVIHFKGTTPYDILCEIKEQIPEELI